MEKEIAKLLQELATQLGTTVEYLWIITVKQAYVAALISVMGCLASIPLMVLNYKLFRVGIKHMYHEDYSKRWDEAAWIPIGIATLAVTIFSLIAWIDGFATIATAIFNPEYWAFKKILSAVKN